MAHILTDFNLPDGNGGFDTIHFSFSPEQEEAIRNGTYGGSSLAIYDVVGMITWQHTLRRGCLKCNGATVTASDYPELLQFVLDNNLNVTAAQYAENCAMYVYNEADDELTLPNLLDRTIWGVQSDPESIEAGLPDIKATLTGLWASSSTASGAISITKTAINIPGGGGAIDMVSTAFDASRANNIYGNSTTVQPPAIGLIPQVRYQSEMVTEFNPNYRKSAKAYSVGDIAYTNKLPSWARLECVVAGTSGSVEPTFTGATVGSYVVDGTAKWIVEDSRNGHFVGEVFLDTVLRPGCVKAVGATASNARENYPRIVQYLTDNPGMNAASAAAQAAAPYLFFYDSTANTIVFPNYTNRFIEGGAALASIEAGLPNITASILMRRGGNGNFGDNSGAFGYGDGTKNYGELTVGATSKTTDMLTLDASLSDSIYGGSNTVQPPAIVAIPQFKY